MLADDDDVNLSDNLFIENAVLCSNYKTEGNRDITVTLDPDPVPNRGL